MEPQTKNCQNCKKDFIIEPDDFLFYEKMEVPPPTFCPECRMQRRFVYRNERQLFKVKNFFTGNDLFSLYPKDGGKNVVSQEEWYGDSWDAVEYGQDYDFSKPFFEQIKNLNKKVPIFNLNVEFMVNSPYSGNASGLKNCYLCFNSNYSEDCMYSSGVDFCKDCIDNAHINKCERCYDSFWLQNCYQCYFSIMSVDSRNLWFCRDCLGCNDCFGCANLRKASYCIFNKQYTKEEYFSELKKMKLNTIQGIEEVRKSARSFWNTQITKYHQGLKNLNSTGSYVTNSKNVKDGYLIREGEDLHYCQYLLAPTTKECYDVTSWGNNTIFSYETIVCGGNSYNLKFCYNCWPSCRDSEYSIDLFSSTKCFGCVGLKKKEFCILNKQYTKDEYYKLVEKIKKHMDEMPYIDKQGIVYKYGEFFPIEISTLGYNNSIAQQNFPLLKSEAIEKGYPWFETSRGDYKITKKYEELVSSIDEITIDLIKETIECRYCKNPYRIMENEFTFLKKEKLPIPDLCNDCRYTRRISDRLKVFLYNRNCSCNGTNDRTGKYKNTVKHIHGSIPCDEKLRTGYSVDDPEIIYCEKCYQQEVI